MFRVGIGQDSHKIFNFQFSIFKNKKPLMLGGVEISRKYYCEANSDGDVVLHSLCNALSSAIGGDSLGTWADEMCLKQAVTDSQKFVKKIMTKLEAGNWKLENISIAIEAARPKIPLAKFQAMKKVIGNLLDIDKDQVGITITSGEGLTEFGKGKGIQAITTVLISL